jgi:alkylation response protein AidB-like acyl-CoA dehydrogenase
MTIVPFVAADPPREQQIARRIASADEALEAASVLAESWTRTAAAIDADRRVPRQELRELDLSGLLAITVPKEHGGPDLPNTVLMRVFRILAAADTALAQVPQNHFDFVDTLASAEPATQDFFYAQVLDGARFGNAIAERGRRSRRDLATTIVEDGEGYRIDGLKAFCTGALTADWVPVLAMHRDGRIRTAYVARDAAGLDVRQDWDAFGQRATFSGTTVLTGVWTPRERVVDRTLDYPELLLAQFAGNQLIHAAIEVGASEGALDHAARLIDSGANPPSGSDLERLGRLQLQTQAARALVDRAARLVDAAIAAKRPSREAAVAAIIAVDEAKSLAYALGPTVTGDLASFGGALARARDGIDRFWRNSRTHSLHDPVRWRQFYVGDYHLNGRLAPDLAGRFPAVGGAC